MPFQIIHQDITQTNCDAIVNPTDEWLSGSGGTDLAIHRAAGPELDSVCTRIDMLGTGEIAVTSGYRLKNKYIFHTVGPIWTGGAENEDVLLRSCYLNALLKADELGLSSIAFPLISSGAYGFPKAAVMRIAIDAISDFLFSAESEMQVFLCILDRSSFALSKEIALKEYLQCDSNKTFVCEKHTLQMKQPRKVRGRPLPAAKEAGDLASPLSEITVGYAMPASAPLPVPDDLAGWIKQQDDSFAVMLLKLIDRKGMTDVQCYKKANVSKGTFWKINNEPNYKPSKTTVLAFAIALELTMEETSQLLKTVGFSLSDSNTFDRIIQFYILNKNYDIFEINAALFQYDQVCLGC